MSAENESPAVTVVIPCYNHSHYLEECLESVRAQTWPNYFQDEASQQAGVEALVRMTGADYP